MTLVTERHAANSTKRSKIIKSFRYLIKSFQIQVGGWFQQKAARAFPIWFWLACRLHWHFPQQEKWTWGPISSLFGWKVSEICRQMSTQKLRYAHKILWCFTLLVKSIHLILRWKCLGRTHWNFGSLRRQSSTHPFVVGIFRCLLFKHQYGCLPTINKSHLDHPWERIFWSCWSLGRYIQFWPTLL